MNTQNVNAWFRKKGDNSFKSPATGGHVLADDAREPVLVKKSATFEETNEFVELKVRLHQQLLDLINLSAIDQLDPSEFRLETATMIKELLAKEQIPLSGAERARLVDDVIDEVLGLGPIEPLLKDGSVSDILVNTAQQIFVERHGVLERIAGGFKDDKHLIRIIDKIVSRVGRRIDESSPLVDARLPDGSRVNAIIPGVSETRQPLEAAGVTLENLRERGANVPLGRVGHPDDIAGMVAILLSPDAAFVTGQSVAINGGAIMLP